MENKKNKDTDRKEKIQQQPDQGNKKDKRPETPEPPQRKDPRSKPESEAE